jgi:branched-chain amino acid transport system substrate-binding protein
MKKIIGVILLVLVIIGLIVWSVTKSTSDSKAVKIGVLVPLSGPTAFVGEIMKKGFDQALSEINANGKVLEVYYEDNKNSPNDAVLAAKNLIELKKVDVIITSTSGSSIAVASYLKGLNKNIPLFATFVYADIPSIYKNAFQMFVSNASESDAFKNWRNEVKVNKLGILYINNEFGTQLKDSIAQVSGLASSNVISESFTMTDKDVKTQLLKLKSAGADAIYVTLLSAPDMFIKEAREIGFKGSLVFSSTIYLNGWTNKTEYDGVYTSVPTSYRNLGSAPAGAVELGSIVLQTINSALKSDSVDNMMDYLASQKEIVTKTHGSLAVDPVKRSVYIPLEIKLLKGGKINY